jgi:hypothetical protein
MIGAEILAATELSPLQARFALLRSGCGARAMDDLVVLALHERRQLNVEHDFLVRVGLESQRRAARLFDDMRHQFLASRVSEVVPDERIAFD